MRIQGYAPPGDSKFLSAKGLTLYFQRYTRIYITPFTFSILSLCVCILYTLSLVMSSLRARAGACDVCA